MLNLLILIFGLAPVAILIHEAGHLFAAKWLKAEDYKIYIGAGPVLFDHNRIRIHLGYFIGGGTRYHFNVNQNSYMRAAVVSLGGPAFNLFCYGLLVTLLSFDSLEPDPLMYYFALFHLWLGLANLLPVKMAQLESDGWSFIRNLALAIRKREGKES
ncbi:MAG: hypothetical protein H0Z33_02925 [Bacillaceae bacterium]|nr:hypothetical protein [Bacillaceae bacterium]